MNVAIYCGSAFGNSKIYEEKTIELAEKLYKNSINIVYGGSKQGLMGIVSNKSLSLGNKVTGVITFDLVGKELENTNISKIYKVESMKERKAKMEELSDAFIALPGGYGTFEEIIDVIASSQIHVHNLQTCQNTKLVALQLTHSLVNQPILAVNNNLCYIIVSLNRSQNF